ncbi:MAG: LysM peptidoglycan-binding domain-containing protein [Bacteroidales bacterium]|jgi:hypothetical protein|nr:LysM peptidoglycan-binding domain-containing protein [Bacteroidales bacterium]
MKQKILLILCLLTFIAGLPKANAQNKDNDTYGWHIISRGENLYRISRHYYLKESDIIEINQGLTAENLKIGQKIKIPLTTRNKKLLKKDDSAKAKNQNLYSQDKNKSISQSLPINTHLNIAMFLPLHYEKLGELGFTNFNINEKRRKEYKSFEYITFYEGARIALNQLEKDGYNVSLYVYDVAENDENAMKQALSRSEIKTMNILIPLVFKQPFDICAEYALQHQIPIVNPMSPNLSILNNNEVFKIQPSAATDVETTMRYIRSNYDKPNITIIHSNTNEEKPIVNYYKQLLENSNDLSWTIIDYNKFSARVTEKIAMGKDNIVISLCNNKGSIDENYAKELLTKLKAKIGCNITLFGSYEWLDLPSIDIAALQQFNFHFLFSYLNDYSNTNFVNFVKEYRANFKGEPDKIYAALGYDIMMFFVVSMIDNGKNFMSYPNTDNVKKMINPFFFDRKDDKSGYQNKRTTIYRISNYKIISVSR